MGPNESAPRLLVQRTAEGPGRGCDSSCRPPRGKAYPRRTWPALRLFGLAGLAVRTRHPAVDRHHLTAPVQPGACYPAAGVRPHPVRRIANWPTRRRPKDRTLAPRWPKVSREPQWEDGEDPVRRRELLAGAAGLVGAAALGLSSVGRDRMLADPGAGLEEMLYHSTANAEPVPLPALRTAVTEIRADFQNARYGRMAASLPVLIATATATRDHADGQERATASTLLADAYITAASFMVKLNDDPLAWTTADRALQAAEAGRGPADARRGPPGGRDRAAPHRPSRTGSRPAALGRQRHRTRPPSHPGPAIDVRHSTRSRRLYRRRRR